MRKFTPITGIAVSVALLAACGPGDGNQGSEDGGVGFDKITIQVPTPPGGGFGLTAQRVSDPLAIETGADVRITYNEGSGQEAAIATYVSNVGKDCSQLLVQATPQLQFATLTNPDLGLSPEDLYPLGAFTEEPSVLLASKGKYADFNDMIEDAKARPGEVVAAIGSITDIAHLGILEIEEATGAEFNKVFYGGGSPARDAVLQGEADITHASVYNAQGAASEMDFLGIQSSTNEFGAITGDAPTIGEISGVEVPDNATRYGLWVTAECKEANPGQVEALEEALDTAVHSDAYQDALKEADVEGQFVWLNGTDFFKDHVQGSEEKYAATIAQMTRALDEEN